MQQVDDPPSLPVGTEVSAKYKGAFCEAKVSKVVRNIKLKVAYKHGLGSGIVSDDAIKVPAGQLRVGAVVEVRHPDRKEPVEATVTKIQDCSQYTVVFDDGDITTLRRTALCLKSGRHFNESETLDQLPLTHPEHFGNPVVGGRRGRRRGQLTEGSSEDEDESDTKEVVNEKEEHIGKVVCVETESKKKDKEKWFPALVVSPTAQATVRIRVKDEYLVRSFKDGRYYTVPKKEATEFTRDAAAKQDGPAVQAALEYLDGDVLPPHWDRDALFGLSNSSSEDDAELDSDSSDDEPHEEKDRFVAQLYKYMDDRGTPLNKVPSIQSRDVDLYRLFRAVQKRGGYNRVTTQNQWKLIALRLGFTPCTVSVMNLVKQAYKKFLQPYGDFHRKLGCSMLMTPRNSNRSKGRSLVRANSVASPKPADASAVHKVDGVPNNKSAINQVVSNTNSTVAAPINVLIPPTSAPPVVSSCISNLSAPSGTINAVTTTAASSVATIVTQTVAEEPGITTECCLETTMIKINKRKSSIASGGGLASGGGAASTAKVKNLVEKYEEKSKDDGDVPLSKMKAAAVATTRSVACDEKDLSTLTLSTKPEVSQSTATNTPMQREASPHGSSTKKDKSQRKQAQLNDDKPRGKRKKDEITVEKIDTGDFVVETGDKLKVYYHEKEVTYEAKVIEISVQRGTPMYLVHYTGWNNRYDEWVPRERIAENLTKGSKQKNRTYGSGGGGSNVGNNLNSMNMGGIGTGGVGCVINERTKESVAKPNSSTMTNLVGSSSSTTSTSGTLSTSKTPITSTGAKRGRGRSDSMPPRSTTPSSVASNSSRTKSPAASNLKKKRPTRTDVSLPSESDTDSDEPVRRPTRSAKEPLYKGGSGIGSKQQKTRTTTSVANSPTDTEDDDEDNGRSATRAIRGSTTLEIISSGGQKGRDYDLNQIRSEFKGFEGLKSPSPTAIDESVEADIVNKKDAILTVKKAEYKVSTTIVDDDNAETCSVSDSIKKGTKFGVKHKTEAVAVKSLSTDMSSETDSSNDDDSQSSDKTTTLENMTKKFQQKINANKHRTIDKQQHQPPPTTGKIVIVEQIIKESMAEKRQEGLKNEYQDETVSKVEHESGNVNNKEIKTDQDMKGEIKLIKSTTAGIIGEGTKPTSSIIAPARFGTTLVGNVSKYTSVIVEKPLSVVKKIDSIPTTSKKPDTIKKTITSTTATESPPSPSITSSKKFIEPVHKETAIIKVEPPAACSPSSSSSSSSSFSSSGSASSTSSSFSSASSSTTTASSTRSLPDMSKLDISGTSSTTSCTSTSSSSIVNSNKELKFHHSSNNNNSNSIIPSKPISPDIYEFKDPEPFEFEIRKSTMVSTCTSVITATAAATTSASAVASAGGGGVTTAAIRKQVLKPQPQAQNDHQTTSATVITHLVTGPSSAVSAGTANRKKRGSPLKEGTSVSIASDKSNKLDKLDEKQHTTNSIVADAKLLHQTYAPSSSTASITATGASCSNVIKHHTSKVITAANLNLKGKIGTNKIFATQSATTAMSSPIPSTTVKTTETSSLYTTPFDVLRKSPSFNLNMNALNEELAQTVQETTRALTDALQKSPTPRTPPLLLPTIATPTQAITTVATNLSTETIVMETSQINSEPYSNSAIIKVTNTTTHHHPTIITNTTPSTKNITTSIQTASNKISVNVGSPFIETRKDLSNVFELLPTECSGYSSSGELKDNKFELENVKNLLSASVGVFDLEPVKYEQKPTSIADKVLKAISQKKEEVENNRMITNKEQESTVDSKLAKNEELQSVDKAESFFPASLLPAKSTAPVFATTQADTAGKGLLLAFDPLSTFSSQLISKVHSENLCGLDKVLAPPSSISKRGSTAHSPEPKSILESITVKNNDLSETIQKLECAIQRKTPVAGLSISHTSMSTPSAHSITSTAGPTSYSDESMDSTDSEQRLVIEDIIAEEQTSTNDLQKSPTFDQANNTIGGPVQIDVNSKLISGNLASTAGLQVPIPLKLVSSTVPTLTTTSESSAGSQQQTVLKPNFSGKIQASVSASPLPMSPAVSTVFTEIDEITSPNKQMVSSKMVPSRSQPSQAQFNRAVVASALVSTVVPIVVPDIPVSVVVASNKVPEFIAATQVVAAASSSMHCAKSSSGGPSARSQHYSANTKVSGALTSVVQTTPQSETSGGIASPIKSSFLSNPMKMSAGGSQSFNSGFFLDERTELCDDDGLKPLSAHRARYKTTEQQSQPTSASEQSGTLAEIKVSPVLIVTATVTTTTTATTVTTMSTNSATPHSSSAGNAVGIALAIGEALNESINLLCEETIPGSPASAFSGKDDTQTITGAVQHTPQRLGTAQTLSQLADAAGSNIVLSVGANPITPTNTITVTAPSSAPNSSPNDSASQDDSSEELKKTLDVENDVTPSKRKRTRKQMDINAVQEQLQQHQQQQTKRRRPLTSTSTRKNTAGSDTDDNSDPVTQRFARQQTLQQQLIQHQQQQQQQMLQHQMAGNGVRPCPYNFLVQLDTSLSSEHCIAILLKQIQELRKTYNTIKCDLASIDRRRKKLRRRERERKQQSQNQQQHKITI